MEPVFAKYRPGTEIAQGGYGSVSICTEKTTRTKYALKIVLKAAGPRDAEGKFRETCLLTEVEILKSMQHPKVVGFQDFLELEKMYAVVMELVPGPELFARIQEKELYSEEDARELLRNLLEAVEYIHSKRIVHRDLKPENLVLADKKTDTHVKLIDFGFAKKAESGNDLMRTWCGTSETPFGMSVDMYAIGVIAFVLVSGYHPFKRFRTKDGALRDDRKMMERRIVRGKLEFHEEYWAGVSEECKDLIAKMLEKEPVKRITAAAAVRHEWFTGADEEQLRKHDLIRTVTEIRDFNAKRKLCSAIHSVIYLNRLETIAKAMGIPATDTPGPLTRRKRAESRLQPASGKKSSEYRVAEAARTMTEIRALLQQHRRDADGASDTADSTAGITDGGSEESGGGFGGEKRVRSMRLVTVPVGRIERPGMVVTHSGEDMQQAAADAAAAAAEKDERQRQPIFDNTVRHVLDAIVETFHIAVESFRKARDRPQELERELALERGLRQAAEARWLALQQQERQQHRRHSSAAPMAAPRWTVAATESNDLKPGQAAFFAKDSDGSLLTSGGGGGGSGSSSVLTDPPAEELLMDPVVARIMALEMQLAEAMEQLAGAVARGDSLAAKLEGAQRTAATAVTINRRLKARARKLTRELKRLDDEAARAAAAVAQSRGGSANSSADGSIGGGAEGTPASAQSEPSDESLLSLSPLAAAIERMSCGLLYVD